MSRSPRHVTAQFAGVYLLVRDGGTWTKEAPGICVGGFVLSAEQERTLQPVRFTCIGLTYQIQEADHG